MKDFSKIKKMDILNIFSRNFLILIIFLSILKEFEILTLPIYINNEHLFILGTVCVFLWSIKFLKSKAKYQLYLKYIFLLGLIFVTLSSFNIPILIEYQLQIIVFTIGFGFLTLFFQKEIPKTKKAKIKVPKWIYPLTLIILISVFSIIQLLKIGDYYFWTDEAFSFNASQMILEKGEPLFDTGYYYSRAPIYHHLMSASMYIFGSNEFGSRLINVFFNILTTIFLYSFISKKSKIFALFASFLFLTSNLTFATTVETRFYSMLTFAFFAMFVSFYYAFIDKQSLLNKIVIFKKPFLFNWKWFLAFLIFSYIALNTHPFAFILFFGLLPYYLYETFINTLNCKFEFQKTLFLALVIIIIFVGAFQLTKTFDLQYAYFDARTPSWAMQTPINTTYYTDILKNNILFYPLFLTLLITITTKKKKTVTYTFFVLLSALYFMSNQRAVEERYLFFLTPIIITAITYSIYYLYSNFKNNKLFLLFLALITIAFTINHFFLYKIEVTNSCKENCLTAYKKLDFYKAMDILNEKKKNDTILLADFHASHTLKAHGFDVNYLIAFEKETFLKSDGVEINGILHEIYFGVPFLLQDSSEYTDIIETKEVLIVARESIYVPEDLVTILDTKPKVFTNIE